MSNYNETVDELTTLAGTGVISEELVAQLGTLLNGETNATSQAIDGGNGNDIIQGTDIAFFKGSSFLDLNNLDTATVKDLNALIFTDDTPVTLIVNTEFAGSIVLGNSDDDTTLSGHENIRIELGDGNNILTTDNGDGNIEVTAGAGNDSIFIGSGNDTVNVGDGSDTVDGGGGNDAIEAGSGNDSVEGGEGNDTIDGGSDNDIINGGIGNNKLIGGAGIDELDYSHFTSAVTVDLSKTTKQKTSAQSTDILNGFENLDGSPYDDKLTGNKVNNVFAGGGGNDTVDGGAGTDTLVLDGTVADYSFSVGKGLKSPFEPFTFTGLKVTDVIEIATSKNNRIKTVGIEKIRFKGDDSTVDVSAKNPQSLLYNAPTYNSDNLVGTAGNDTIAGGQGNDTLDGGTGYDTLIGGVGNDTYIVDSINDVITELAVTDSGTDTIYLAATYAADSYSLSIATNVEKLSAGSLVAAIALTGNSGNNTITGGAGDDSLDGGAGADSLAGGLGNDTYIIDSSKDKVTESSKFLTEIDTVQSSINYTLGLNLENLTLTGSASIGTGNALDNSLVGNDGKNNLKGKAGNDTLDGGTGADTLDGGTGNDTLIYSSDDSKVDGGAGSDLLKLSGSDITLNLSQLPIGRITSIEKLDLSGTGINSLLVNATKLVNLTGLAGNKLYVTGDEDDSVTIATLTGAMWMDKGIADGYHLYINITGTMTYYLYVSETLAQILE